MTPPRLFAVLSLLLLGSAGCGTLTSGTTQNLHITVEPADATVNLYRLDGEHVAGPGSNGSMTVPRPVRGLPYLSLISRDGHCPAYGITKVNDTPGGITGAAMGIVIPIFGVVSMLVDSSTGGCCAVEPIAVKLSKDSACD